MIWTRIQSWGILKVTSESRFNSSAGVAAPLEASLSWPSSAEEDACMFSFQSLAS